IKNLYKKTPKDLRGDNEPMSTEKGNPGVTDKNYDLSQYLDKASSIEDLVSSQNLLLAVATQQCESQFGPGRSTVSEKTRKAIVARITKDYPDLSSISAEMIVNEPI